MLSVIKIKVRNPAHLNFINGLIVSVLRFL